MNSNEKLSVKGNLNIVLTDAQGNVKDSRQVNNLVVTSGISFILNRMKDNVTYPAGMTHMAVGTGTVPAAAADSGITILGSRQGLTSTTVTTAPDKITYVAGFGTGVSTGAITEAGLFNALTGGAMLARVKFDVINKGANDSMTITWAITLTAS